MYYYKNIGMWPKTTTTRLMCLPKDWTLCFEYIYKNLTNVNNSFFHLQFMLFFILYTKLSNVQQFLYHQSIYLFCISNLYTATLCSFYVCRRVRTLYACLGENDGELSFEPNQIITNGTSNCLCLNSVINWVISANFAH